MCMTALESFHQEEKENAVKGALGWRSTSKTLIFAMILWSLELLPTLTEAEIKASAHWGTQNSNTVPKLAPVPPLYILPV